MKTKMFRKVLSMVLTMSVAWSIMVMLSTNVGANTEGPFTFGSGGRTLARDESHIYRSRYMCRGDTVLFSNITFTVNRTLRLSVLRDSGSGFSWTLTNGASPYRNTWTVPSCETWRIRVRNDSSSSLTINSSSVYTYNFVNPNQSRGVCTDCGYIRNHADSRSSTAFEHYMFRGSSLPTHVTGDYFSRYPDNTRHIGLDIERVNRGNSMERRIYAQGPGRVIYIRSNNNSEAGLFVVIRYDNGRTARYLHLYSISSTLSSNQRVDHTTPIGRVGNSGSASQVTWGRLHFDVNTGGHIYGDQIRQNNSHVNPARMFPDGTFTGTVGMGSSW